jgi:hypothetical protein
MPEPEEEQVGDNGQQVEETSFITQWGASYHWARHLPSGKGIALNGNIEQCLWLQKRMERGLKVGRTLKMARALICAPTKA